MKSPRATRPLWVVLDTRLGGVSRQKLRLRGIDAPEINTAAGRRAFEFLKATLAKAPYLIVRSSKNDKFDRYEADLFIPAKNAVSRSPESLELADLIFINNLLLERGFAVQLDE
ncbi:MAG: thermonuclease family protein [Candidatus Omnitrophica bacterium]|nr:thermonuclease family protein [Candidatus Omnitrophota bacterium]